MAGDRRDLMRAAAGLSQTARRSLAQPMYRTLLREPGLITPLAKLKAQIVPVIGCALRCEKRQVFARRRVQDRAQLAAQRNLQDDARLLLPTSSIPLRTCCLPMREMSSSTHLRHRDKARWTSIVICNCRTDGLAKGGVPRINGHCRNMPHLRSMSVAKIKLPASARETWKQLWKVFWRQNLLRKYHRGVSTVDHVEA